MQIAFYKFHGTGNDFILVDDRKLQFPVNKVIIHRLCDRHFGIGADGLILLRNKQGYDFEMIYFNSDGNESTMCGNGGRCIIAFADFLSLIGSHARFLAVDGTHEGDIKEKKGNTWQVGLKMSDVLNYERIGEDFRMDTGSPHLVCFSQGIDQTDIAEAGRAIRYSEKFREEGINVDFVEAFQDELYVRTYERGVEDETLSCGTGVTASALAYALKSGKCSGSATIRTKGGQLEVSFSREGDVFSNIWLSGPAKLVYNGYINISELIL
jgi:diaminopimelate epimerase